MKTYRVKHGKTIVDDVGNVVAHCTWKNAAARIAKLLNNDAPPRLLRSDQTLRSRSG
jgi:hypothetical protein